MSDQALARRMSTGISAPEFTNERVELIRKSIASGLSQTEFESFIEIARHAKLNPLAKELFVWKDQGRLVIHTGIEGLRLIAERSEEYLGMDGPEFCGPDGKWVEMWPGPDLPAAARVIVYREGRRPAKAVVHMSEFRKENSDTWKRRPVHMLGIRAEGHALRKAFRAETHALRIDWNEEAGGPASEIHIVHPEGRPSNDQQAWLHIFAQQQGWSREERHRRAAEVLGRPIDVEVGFAGLTKREAQILRSAWEDGELVEDVQASDSQESAGTPAPGPKPGPQSRPKAEGPPARGEAEVSRGGSSAGEGDPALVQGSSSPDAGIAPHAYAGDGDGPCSTCGYAAEWPGHRGGAPHQSRLAT